MFDEVSTTPQNESLAETTLQTELERQAETELRLMLIAKARRERAESAAFTAAALADPAGMRIEAPVLWNRCSAAVNLARKATRAVMSEDDFRDAVADLVCHAIRNDSCGDAAMQPASLQPYWKRRETADPLQALFHAPYGTPRADARAARLERDARLFAGNLPRAGRCAMPWLQATANGRLKNTMTAANSHGSRSELEGEAEIGRYLADLTAADIAASLPEVKPAAIIALRAAVDGESLADIGAELGMSHDSARKSAQRGRAILADQWEDVQRAVCADPSDPLDKWAIDRSILEREQSTRPDRAGATYRPTSRPLPLIRTAADVLRRITALERAAERIARYAPNSVQPADEWQPSSMAAASRISPGQWAANSPLPNSDMETPQRPSTPPTGDTPTCVVGSALQALGRTGRVNRKALPHAVCPTDWPSRAIPCICQTAHPDAWCAGCETDDAADVTLMLAQVAGYDSPVTLESDEREQRPAYVSRSRNIPAPSAA